MEEFAEHVRQLHANDNYLFTEEYAVRTLSLIKTATSFNAPLLLTTLLLSAFLLQLVEPEHHPTYEHCRRPENIQKNRYANITACKTSAPIVMVVVYYAMFALLPDDHSRVTLEEIPNEPGSDYINGNFIDVR